MDYDLTTNMGRWKCFLSQRPSPEIFIEYGFVSLVASALQRRIWAGDDLSPLYSNTYTILCGPVGVGKGLVTGPVEQILREHKLATTAKLVNAPAATPQATGPASTVHKNTKEVTSEDLKQAAQFANELLEAKDHEDNTSKRNIVTDKEQKLLIPVAGDASTFEALVRNMAKSFRVVPYEVFNEPLGRVEKKIYTHSSLCFVLDELASLFRSRRETKDLCRFFLTAYMCRDYRYETKDESRVDYVKKCCLNMLAGTNPSFMEESLDSGIMEEGITSRSWFVWADKNRFSKAVFDPFTEEQLKCRATVASHIKDLASIPIGKVYYTKEACDFLEAKWARIESGYDRVNKHIKMIPYYARWQIHVQKMAMILHFADIKFEKSGSYERTIGIETFQRAITQLEKAEASTHNALNFKKVNPLSKLTSSVQKYIAKKGTVTFSEMLFEFYDELPHGRRSLDEIVIYLSDQHLIEYAPSETKPNETIIKLTI